MSESTDFIVRFRPERDQRAPDYRLKCEVKHAKRCNALRCVDYREIPSDTPLGTWTPAQAAQTHPVELGGSDPTAGGGTTKAPEIGKCGPANGNEVNAHE